ncbi:MAG: hypothetical protein ACYS8W_03955 [Planctomycetota bacterium]
MEQKINSKTTRLLTHRRLPLAVAVVAAVLTLPSLKGGLMMDDFRQRIVVHQPELYTAELPHMMDTYDFASGDPEKGRRDIDFGCIPWYANPEFRGRFWRPLTSATQVIDHKIWPDSYWLMHLQSVLWYAALALVAAIFFRRFMGVTLAAGLAALMFAMDDAHAMPVGWLANRHSIIACLFGLLALMMHHSWRSEGRKGKGVAAVAFFAAALLSGEAGIGAGAYIGAYALCLERGSWRARAVSMLPYIVVVIIWRAVWCAMGYGISEGGFYVDPLKNPLLYVSKLWIRLPILITGQCALPPSILQLLMFIIQPLFILPFAAIALFFLWAAYRLMKTDRVARFFGTGALIAMIPACAALPFDRNLVFVGIGAFGLFGMWLARQREKEKMKRLARITFLALVGIHFVFSPLFLMGRSRLPFGPGSERIQELVITFPNEDRIAGRTLIVVNHPAPMAPLYDLGDRAIKGAPMPARTRVLAQIGSPITLERTSPTRIRMRCEYGFTDLFTRLLNDLGRKMSAGDEIRLTGMTVLVTEADKVGIPIEATFTFDRDLEDESLVWVQWSADSFIPFRPPLVGKTINLEPPPTPIGLTNAEVDAAFRRFLH